MTATYAIAGGFAARDAAGPRLLIHQAYGERQWDFVGGAGSRSSPGGVPEQMTFSDPQHGQLLVRRTDTARTETTAIFVTDDNGAHWQMR